jgi:cysteine desulfurase
MNTIYFDHNATTPLDARVRAAMEPCLGEVFGNPSSVHRLGQRARALLDDARERVARTLQCKPAEIVFTSGGTESDNLAIFGLARHYQTRGRHIITSSIEHHAVLHACEYLRRREGFEVTQLPVDGAGMISPRDLEMAIRPDTILVTLMAANNEVGTVQPVAELGAICREKGVFFHTDAVQWFGKEPSGSIQQFNAQLVSLCGHKIYGPKGCGLLYLQAPLPIDSVLLGGGQENERRAGTENLANILGLADAVERFIPRPVFDRETLQPLTDRLLAFLDSLPPVRFCGSRAHRLVNTIAFTVPGADSLAVLAGLDLEGICVSSGSACTAGSIQPSHVLSAMGIREPGAMVRISLGRDSTRADVEAFERSLPRVLARL